MADRLVIGCGYVGERVAARWKSDGHQVWVLTRSPERADGLKLQGFQPLLGDVVDWQPGQELPRFEFTLYAVGFDRAGQHDKRTVYVDGLRHALANLGNHSGRVIYVSSTSVYGQSDGEWVDESSECEPTSESGRICLDAEQTVWAHVAATDHTAAVVLRLAGIYGPGRLLRRLEQLRAGDPIGGRPDAFLNLIHVDDAVSVIEAVCVRFSPGETYLVCDGQELTRQAYYEILSELTDSPAPVFDSESPGRSSSLGLNKRCRHRKICDQLGIRLSYPDARSGLVQALAAR